MTRIIDPKDDIETAVFKCIGAASVCWTHIDGERVFDSTRAKEIGDELVAYVRMTIEEIVTGVPQQ